MSIVEVLVCFGLGYWLGVSFFEPMFLWLKEWYDGRGD